MAKRSFDEIAQEAVDYGFSHASALDAATLELRQEVRDMCASGRCQRYGTSWMCPPGCASLEENAKQVATFRGGIVVQTTGQMEDDFDYETIQATEEKHKELFEGLHAKLREEYPDMLALGAGTCTICAKCTYPDAPCRFPQRAVSSMEAFGLIVTDVCIANGLQYKYGPQSMTYTSCYLLE